MDMLEVDITAKENALTTVSPKNLLPWVHYNYSNTSGMVKIGSTSVWQKVTPIT